MADPDHHLDRLAPANLPWAWFLFAHVALLTALATLAADPEVVGGFYYHPKAIGLVHLITLGWISCNIIGSLYLVGPVAMRVRLAGGRIGGAAFLLVAVGIIGMVSHFWIDAYSGMVWSAGSVLAGLLLLGVRAVPTFLGRGVPATVRWHLGLAFLNLLLAGLLGALIGVEKLGGIVLPGTLLDAVRAHAHLAAIGWGLMMVMGVGYRLLPMQLPSAIPEGSGPRHTAWLLEAGLCALVVGALSGRPAIDLAGAVLCLVALAAFVRQLAWMGRNRRRPPAGLPRPDPALLLTGHSILYLAVAAATGGLLLWLEPSELEIRLTFVYGIAGLLGFLGQIVVGVGGRLLPLSGWMRGFVEGDFEPPEIGLYELTLGWLQWLTLVAWVMGLPALIAGLAMGRPMLVRLGACSLGVAALADGWNRLRVWRWARSRRTGVEI